MQSPSAEPLLTVEQVIEELGISRETWNKWRGRRVSPPMVRLPNASLRIRRSELDSWLDGLSESEAA